MIGGRLAEAIGPEGFGIPSWPSESSRRGNWANSDLSCCTKGSPISGSPDRDLETLWSLEPSPGNWARSAQPMEFFREDGPLARLLAMSRLGEGKDARAWGVFESSGWRGWSSRGGARPGREAWLWGGGALR